MEDLAIPQALVALSLVVFALAGCAEETSETETILWSRFVNTSSAEGALRIQDAEGTELFSAFLAPHANVDVDFHLPCQSTYLTFEHTPDR